MAPFRARSRLALVAASVARAGGDGRVDAKARSQPSAESAWQKRAFGHYDATGEIWYASQFYSRALSQLQWYIAVEDEETGERSRVGDDDAPMPPGAADAQAILARIADDSGGHAAKAATYGRLMFLAGECYLLGYAEDDGDECWEIVSHLEVRVADGKIIRKTRPSGSGNETEYVDVGQDVPAVLQPGEAALWRFHRPHPVWSGLADSPLRAVLDLADELQLLTLAVGARAKNRAAGAGILVIPNNLSFPSPEAADDSDPDADPFLRTLARQLTAPLSDPGDASAVVPLLVRAQMNDAGKSGIEHIDLGQASMQYPESELRTETIKRIALGIDLPPEILLGLTDANHWTAWQIDESAWQAHLQPVAEMMADHLTMLIRPVAPRDSHLRVWFDPTDVIVRPDRTQNAMEAHDRFVISDDALRDALGFDATDAPDQSAESTPATEPVPPPVPAEGPPAQQAAAPALLLVADMAIERAREMAGSRLRNQACESEKKLLRDVPNRLVCAEAALRGWALRDADSLVAGSTQVLGAKLADWRVPEPIRLSIEAEVERVAAESLYAPAYVVSPHLQALVAWATTGVAL